MKLEIIKKIINKFLGIFNVKLVSNKHQYLNDFKDIFVKDKPENFIINISKLSGLSNNIRGMISSRAGEELFALAYMQSLNGDIVEVGSFQGKSTFFLGLGVKLSENGKMFAIDHFKGNIGKENFYIVEKSDLSDLEFGFRENITRAELDDTVTLFNMPNDQAVKHINDNSVRLLFIDSDHTAEGVAKDLKLFKSKLKPGAIIVFDDYSNNSFPGVVQVSNDFISSENIKKKYLLGRTLVIELAP